QRVEAAFDEHFPSDGPDRDGRVEPLERMQPEVHAFEEIADQAASLLCDRDGVRRRDFLQTFREIRRLADHALLGRSALADEVADDYRTRRDADPDVQLDVAPGRELRYRRRDLSPRANGVLGIVLARLGIAEVDEQPVPHVARDLAAVLLNDRLAA